jgi:hypothetical protein
MEPIYQETLEECVAAFGEAIQVEVDAYHRARTEAQASAAEALEARKKVGYLLLTNPPAVDWFQLKVEVVVQNWTAYRSAWNACVAARSVRQVISRETDSMFFFDDIRAKAQTRAKVQTIVVTWITKITTDISDVVSDIQQIMATVVTPQLMHRESLNKLLSVICEVVAADAAQLLWCNDRVQRLIVIAEDFKTETMSRSLTKSLPFTSQVTDVRLNWDVVYMTAQATIIAYNLWIATNIAKDIAQLFMQAMETEAIAATKEQAPHWVGHAIRSETEAQSTLSMRDKWIALAIWAEQAIKSETEWQSTLSMRDKWIALTMDKIDTAISTMEIIFQTEANHTGITLGQQVPPESLKTLLEVTCKMVDFQSTVVVRETEQHFARACSWLEMDTSAMDWCTFRKLSAAHKAVTQVMDAHGKIVQAAEHVTMIKHFWDKIAKLETVTDLHKMESMVKQKLIQARNALARLTVMEEKRINEAISAIDQTKNASSAVIAPLIPPVSTISSLPRLAVHSIFFPATVPTTAPASSGAGAIEKKGDKGKKKVTDTETKTIKEQTSNNMKQIQNAPPAAVTASLSPPVPTFLKIFGKVIPRKVSNTTSASAKVNTEQTNSQKDQEERRTAEVLVHLSSTISTTTTVSPSSIVATTTITSSGVNTKPTGIEKKQKKRKRNNEKM